MSPGRLPLHLDTPSCELHAVDGLQYVHALLASIKLPSGLQGSSNTQHMAGAMDAAAAAGTGIEGPSGAAFECSSSWVGDGNAVGVLAVAGVPYGSMESQAQSQQQQETCMTALAQLRAKGAAAASVEEVAGASLLEMNVEQQQQQQQPAEFEMQLEDALVLLCLASNPPEQRSSPACSATATAKVAQEIAAASAEAKHAALHVTLQRCLHWHYEAAAGSTLQQKQRQRQQHQGRVKGIRLLCVRAIGSVVAERQDWCDQQLQHTWGCLKQVDTDRPLNASVLAARYRTAVQDFAMQHVQQVNHAVVVMSIAWPPA
jgi:hypothetical protein